MADGVGGTWYWNLSGLGAFQSHSYSYYFSKELLEWEWSERYPGQAEIKRYLDHVADRFDLRRDIGSAAGCCRRFITRPAITGTLRPAPESATGRHISSQRSAACPQRTSLTSPVSSFAGVVPHRPRPHERRLHRQTGRADWHRFTGIQAVRYRERQRSAVFQRTANYGVKARNGPLSDAFKQYMNITTRSADHAPRDQRSPFRSTGGPPSRSRRSGRRSTRKRGRSAVSGSAPSSRTFSSTRRRRYRRRLHQGQDREIVKTGEGEGSLRHRSPLRCRRPLDTNYFETYNQTMWTSSMSARTHPDTPTGVETGGAHYDLDVIVFATGFDA